MSYELQYTSAPRGLYGAASGFCTVKATHGIPLALRELLESMSHYKHLYPPHHQLAALNPVNFSNVTASIGGKRWHIISRIQAAGLDHTKRGNFFAHHLALESSVARMTCPTRIMGRSDLLLPSWDFKVEEVMDGRAYPQEKEPLRRCVGWEAVCGDAGWAGVAAERLRDRQKVYVVFEAGMQTLALVSEILCLLGSEEQGDATFSTYFAGGSQMVDCKLRFVAAGSDEYREAVSVQSSVIDLSTRLGEATGGALVEAARSGVARNGSMAASSVEEAASPLKEVQAYTLRRPTPSAPQASASISSVKPSAKDRSRVAFSPPPDVPYEMQVGREAQSAAWWLAPVSALGGVVLALVVTMPIAFWFRSGLLAAEAKVSELNTAKAELEDALEASRKATATTAAALQDQMASREKDQKESDESSKKQSKQHRDQVARLNGEITTREATISQQATMLAEQREANKRLEADVRRLGAEKTKLEDENKELIAKLRKARETPDVSDDAQ